MHKVIAINLNGNAYQFDEPGYELLRTYLADAGDALKDNPDRSEIMADLEQAIADKCHAYLGPHKSVISADETRTIVTEMGPVEGAAGGDTKASGADEGTDAPRDVPPNRLYRVPEGSMVAGVCTGLAAYFRLDVALVRIAFVIAGLLTKGVAIVAYVVMMFAVPEAATPEQAAGGAPLNAKDVINRARIRTAATGREWTRHWRAHRRDWRRQWRAGAVPPPPIAVAMAPLFGLAQVAVFLVMAWMLISLVNTGAILDWRLPEDVPVWAAALVLFVGYQIVVSPLRAAGHWGGSPAAGPFAFWSAVGWLIGMAFAVWLASNHIPDITEFVRRVPDMFRDFVDAMGRAAQR